ncbi:MAG TPA: DeoR family transcriptional regulator [Caulobacteraceae bacterium]
MDNSTSDAEERLLGLLKRQGPLRTSELAARLAITTEAARQQLNRLAREGLVAPEIKRGPVGRPSQRWRLTAAAEGRFPDAHAELTVRLIEAVRAELGEEALDRLVMAHERRARETYLAELADAQGAAQKIARLAALRTREGYMADWDAFDGVWLLTENHCPICAAAKACQGFCRAELALFQEVLGPELEVTRTDHIAAGARRCAYRIVQAEPA